MNSVVTWLLRILGWISGHIARTPRQYMGKAVGWLLMTLSSKRKNITFNNIRQAFPDHNSEWQWRVVRESYHNLGITLVEFAAIPYLRDEEIASWFTFRNEHIVQQYQAQGKGMIFLSGHYGNWELGAYAIGLRFNIELTIVVKPQRNPLVDELTNRYRTRATNKVVEMFNAAKPMLNALEQGKIVAMLADQAADPKRDVFVDFFGRAAATYKAPAVLALRNRVPIITGYVTRTSEGNYIIDLQEVPHHDIENTPEGVRTLVQRYTASLEDAIRQYPALWSWQHKRWKYNPNDYRKDNQSAYITHE